MTDLNLLIVEDDDEQVKSYIYNIDDFQEENNIQIDVKTANNFDTAVDLIYGQDFDCAIIDLKLDTENPDEFAGLELIDKITDKARCPVIVLSANPENVPEEAKVVMRLDRTTEFKEVLKKFMQIKQSGLTNIMKRTGIIEDFLNHIYWRNIIPNIDTWLKYVQNGKDTNKPLLRFTVNHLLQLLEEGESSLPEEMYIRPPMNANLRTGSITKKKKDADLYVVLSPECDLVLRGDGTMKTDRILMCRINTDLVTLYKDEISKSCKPEDKTKKKRSVIEDYIKNNKAINYHWLPGTNFFSGGVIQFRDVHSCTPDEYKELFEPPNFQISPPFTKNILGRFSTYYSRQGQPDFEFRKLAKVEFQKIPIDA